MTTNIDHEQIALFSRMAKAWWDKNGEMKALHEINPVRLAYICSRVSIRKKSVLDVGCGGGLLTEGMAASGAVVTGIDMAAPALDAAKHHMHKSGLDIDYIQDTPEGFAHNTFSRFDLITCMELLEHVPDPASTIRACARLAKPGGDLIFSTINKTFLSYVLIILVSEHVLGIINKGTHTFQKLVPPLQLEKWGKTAGLQHLNVTGVRYIPFIGYSRLCRDTTMNYMMHFKKMEN